MNQLTCIEVHVSGNLLTMTFLGTIGVERDDFLEEAHDYLFLNWFDKEMHPLFRLLREIIKNVFDHGTGEGILELRKEGGCYEFQFIDHSPFLISFAEICKINKDNGWTQKSSQNRNHGMQLIQSLSKEKGMTLEVNDSNGGIDYRGTYNLES